MIRLRVHVDDPVFSDPVTPESDPPAVFFVFHEHFVRRPEPRRETLEFEASAAISDRVTESVVFVFVALFQERGLTDSKNKGEVAGRGGLGPLAVARHLFRGDPQAPDL